MTTISTPIGRRRSRSGRAHLRKSLLTLHVVTAVGLLGSVAGLLVAATRAATRDDPVDAHAIYELMAILPFALGIPLSFLALGSGVVLGLASRRRPRDPAGDSAHGGDPRDVPPRRADAVGRAVHAMTSQASAVTARSP